MNMIDDDPQICMYVRTYVRTYVCMHECTYVCMYIYNIYIYGQMNPLFDRTTIMWLGQCVAPTTAPRDVFWEYG